jgi:Zn ribbon nucleic-acid-binding protein
MSHLLLAGQCRVMFLPACCWATGYALGGQCAGMGDAVGNDAVIRPARITTSLAFANCPTCLEGDFMCISASVLNPQQVPSTWCQADGYQQHHITHMVQSHTSNHTKPHDGLQTHYAQQVQTVCSQTVCFQAVTRSHSVAHGRGVKHTATNRAARQCFSNAHAAHTPCMDTTGMLPACQQLFAPRNRLFVQRHLR